MASSTFHGVMFYFIYTKIFSLPTYFKDYKPFEGKNKKRCEIQTSERYPVSVNNYIYVIFLFVYTLIRRRRET